MLCTKSLKLTKTCAPSSVFGNEETNCSCLMMKIAIFFMKFNEKYFTQNFDAMPTISQTQRCYSVILWLRLCICVEF